jgi:hypothetical protein
VEMLQFKKYLSPCGLGCEGSSLIINLFILSTYLSSSVGPGQSIPIVGSICVGVLCPVISRGPTIRRA